MDGRIKTKTVTQPGTPPKQLAIIQSGSQQLKVMVGQHIWIDKVDLPVGSEIIFDQVLMIDDHFGQPLLPQARVQAEVIKTNQAKKIFIFKYKPKKGYHKKQGHRQWQTKVLIKQIALNGVFQPSPRLTKKNNLSQPKKQT